MSQTPAVLYAAKSTEDTRGSIPTQLEDGRALAERSGWTVVAEFQDEGFSAYSGSRGPGLAAALAEAERVAGESGGCHLVVQHSDRLARGDGKTAAHLVEHALWALKHDVTIVSVQDAQTFGDLLYTVVTGQRNHEDSKRKSAATRDGKRRRFESGKRLGGPVPDGYKLVDKIGEGGRAYSVYVIDEARAPVIRRVYELSLSGLGAPSVARKLNEAGLRTGRGKPWSRRRVRQTLTNRFYVGVQVMHGETVAGDWPALIDAEDFDRVQRLIRERDATADRRARPEGRRSRVHHYALAKLGVCDRCGGRTYARTSSFERRDGTRQRVYVCGNTVDGGGCDLPRLDASKIDAAVIQHLNRLFIDVSAWAAELARGGADQRAALEAELSAALTARAKLDGRDVKLRDRFIATDEADPLYKATAEAYAHVIEERDTLKERIRSLQEALAAEPDQPATDALLDVYNDLAAAVRGQEGESLAELNDRLRGIFEAFRLDEVEPGVVGILPVLKPDVVERYAELTPLALGDDGGAKLSHDLPATSPTVMFTRAPRPPGLPIRLAEEDQTPSCTSTRAARRSRRTTGPRP